MTGYRNYLQNTAAGIAACLIAATAASGVAAQQRPLSINDWLQAERSNANMQRAVEQYERARFGTATPQQPQYRQPQYQQPQYQQPRYPEQAQAPAAAPQQPVQPVQPVQPQPLIPNEPPGYQQPRYPQQPYANQAAPGGQLPQGQTGRNTYQVPPNALEKIDREYNPGATGQEQASSPFFVSAHLGLPLIPQLDYGVAGGADFEPLGLYADAGIGMKLSKEFSLDLEFSYLSNDFDENNVEGGISMYTMMANANYERNIGIGLVPYATGGIGPALYRIEDALTSTSDLSGSDIVFAYQLGTGLMYYFTPNTALDIGYMYRGATDASINSAAADYEAEFESHILMVGFRHQL